MSVISIRPAAERLQNLGDLRRPDRMPHFVAPDMSGQKAMARSYGDLGRGVAHFGSALIDIAVAMKKEDEDRRLAAAGAEYQRRLQAGFLEGDDPIMARQGDALEGEGLKKTQADTQQLFNTSFDEVCTRYGIDGRIKEKFALHVAPVALSWNGRMDSHVMVERKKNAITAADATVAEDEATWAGDRFNAGMTKKLLDDYDHKLKVRGATEEVRNVEVRKYALGLAAGIARSSLDGIDSEEAFDEHIRLMKEDPDGMFNDNAELSERLGKDALPKETVDLLVGEAKMRKKQFIRERTKAVNDQVDALVVEGDLGKMDKGVDDLRKSADAMKEGGRVRTATLEAAAKLDKAADSLAQYQLMNDLANGEQVSKYGLRHDGKSYKGTGWLGELPIYKDGKQVGVATEYSMQSNAVKDKDGNRIDFPTLVPTLTQDEVDLMTKDIIPNNKPVPDDIAQKAVDHALSQMEKGESVWANDGDNEITNGDPRKERLFPKVYAAFQDQRRKEFNKGFRAAHDQNLLVADAAMMQYAANGNPQGFYGFLTEAVVNRKITTGDFTRLRDKFNNGWMKGFSAMPGQQSKQSAMAQDMLDAIKTKLGVDMSVAIKTDDYGDPAIRNGAIDWDDKALEKGDVELPDASVRRQYQAFDRPQGIFRLFASDTPTRKETIEGRQLRAALDEAMKLWNSDGMQIEIDPVTGERLPDGKTHTVNAVADFNALLDRLVDERNILSAADTLKQQNAYAENVRGNAMAAEVRRAEKRTNSKPVTDEQVEKKDDKGE